MATLSKTMRRGVVETLGGPYTQNTTEPLQWNLPTDAAGDQVFAWQTVKNAGGGNTFTSITVTLNASLDGANFSQYDLSTAITGEIRFPSGRPVTIQIVVSNLVVNAGTPSITVLGIVK